MSARIYRLSLNYNHALLVVEWLESKIDGEKFGVKFVWAFMFSN